MRCTAYTPVDIFTCTDIVLDTSACLHFSFCSESKYDVFARNQHLEVLTSTDWSSFHAEGPEIWQYIRDTTTQYGLDEKIQFNSRIIETIWNDSIGKWDIKVEYNGDIVSDQADVLINGAGILNKWRWPDINGLFSFEGALVHTANWDRDLSWEGKRVALIGNGSSGVQILPEVQKTAAHLTTYIRTPTWISPPVGAELTKEGKNFQYTEEEKKEFRDDPEKLKALRKALDQSFNQMFPVLFSDGPHQAGAQQALRQHMSDQLGGDPELCEKLIPKFNVGCRRLTPGVGYLEAITQDNVNIEFGEIEEITKNGIRTVNGLNSFDIIICATGFDVSFTPFWKLIGKNGTNLADKWSKNPVCSARPRKEGLESTNKITGRISRDMCSRHAKLFHFQWP